MNCPDMASPPWRASLGGALCVLLAAALTGCGARPVVKERAFMMGTVVDITIHHGNEEEARSAAMLAFREGKRLAEMLGARGENSEIALINENAGSPVAVSEETFFLVRESLKYGDISGGAFDITAAPLLELWGFAAGEFRVPGEEEIADALRLVDYRKIILDPEGATVALPEKGMKIDLGGIAKGYIVDRMASVLRDAGISGALVNAGGDIYALGSSHWGGGWRVGIRHPRLSGKIAGIEEIRDKAIATSGDYEKFFFSGGVRYSHIFDPGSGRPAEGVLSVTVISDSAMKADALSTMLFVMGEEKGREIAEKLGAEAIFFPEGWEEADERHEKSL